jgi:D-serine deaminase-like pyridoxal phosphate-dependent protein
LKKDYRITNVDKADSPALLVYPDIIKQNIATAVRMAGGPGRLRPHVKTHKMVEVTRMLLEAGINKFKCATIAELEMLTISGAKDILLAYQPTTVKAKRLARIAEAHPGIRFGYLVDNQQSAKELSQVLARENLRSWVDVNVGMNRTGTSPEKAALLFRYCKENDYSFPVGLHAYDGHIHDTDVDLRYKQAQQVFKSITELQLLISKQTGQVPAIVLGGTPCFPYYAQQENVETSPGTFVFWDQGYTTMLPDMKFDIGAMLLTRIISIIDSSRICLDLGHKSIAAEGLLPRVFFPDHPNAKVLSQSEEHMVVEVMDSAAHHVGEAWYGIPTHICPTVALYESVFVVEDNDVSTTWKVIARDRKITY